MRIFAASNRGLFGVALLAAVPRLLVLAHERGAILASYVEKSDQFAQTFVRSGTFGFVPGVPSAYVQPLYAWFLIPFYWVDRTWLLVGTAQVALACLTAVLVLEIGTRLFDRTTGVLAAAVTTLNPYLLWHDVHINREIVDQPLAAAIFLLTILVARKPDRLRGAALGAVLGLAILGESRLVLLPIPVFAYVLAQHRDRRTLVALWVAACAAALVVAPWVVRNRVQVGCFALTTDSRALWKANNVNTYSTLAHGGWIDDVPPLPGASPVTPAYEVGNPGLHVNECADLKTYQSATLRFWRDHPGEKLRLMGQATEMLWQPTQTRTEGGPANASFLRRWLEAGWTLPVYLLTLAGLFLVPRRIAALAVIFLAYETLEAWIFAGSTRYRISFDFVLALVAAHAVRRLLSSSRYTAITPSTAAPAEN